MIKHLHNIKPQKIKAGKGAYKQLLISSDEAPHFALRRFVIKSGGEIPAHTNTVEHEQYVLAGKAKIGIGEASFHVKKDSIVYIPAGVPHWYKVVGSEDFEFLCIVPNQTDHMDMIDNG